MVPPHRCTAAAPDPTEETSSRNSPQLTQFTQKSGLLWTQFSRHNKHESSHRHLPSTLLFEIYGSEDFIWLLCALSFSQVSRHGLHHFTDDYSHLSSGTARQSQQVEERHQVYKLQPVGFESGGLRVSNQVTLNIAKLTFLDIFHNLRYRLGKKEHPKPN